MKRPTSTILGTAFGAALLAACNWLFPLDGLRQFEEDAGATDAAVLEASTCPNGETLCADRCLDTSADPNNCGACGVLCKESGCSRGLCGVRIFAGEKGTAEGLVVDQETAHWMVGTPDSTRIFSVDLTNPDAGVRSRIAVAAGYTGLVVAERRMFFHDNRSIMVREDAGAGVELTRVGPTEQIVALALLDPPQNALYLSAKGNTLIGRIVSTQVGGGSAQDRFVATFGEPRTVADLVVEGDDAFFLVAGNDTGQLLRANKLLNGPSNVTTLAQTVEKPGGVALEGNASVAWSGGGVFVSNRNGAALRTLVRSGTDTFSDLALAESAAYFLVPSANALRRVARDGGSAVTIGSADGEPSRVVLSSGYVLWIRTGSLIALPR